MTAPVPVDRVDVTVLVDNSTDMLLPDVSPDAGPVRRWGLAGTAAPIVHAPSDVTEAGSTLGVLRAEHGYAALVDVHRDGRVHRVLYDTGPSVDGLVHNLDRLGIAAGTVDALVLSHGHFDHTAGLHGLLRRLAPEALPVHVHPDVWTRRRLASPGRALELPTLDRAVLSRAGVGVVEEAGPSLLADGALLLTGEVPRTTSFETGMPPGHQAWRGDGWEHDPLVREDQALVAHVRGRGLVVVTGCAHAGVVNIVRHAKRLTGVPELALVTGGLHLREGPVLTASVAALTEERPDRLAPAHCTSWTAHHALQTALPDAYLPSSVGTRFELPALS
jgi:7,8-dihydropterin-6-yl-methyl-4-(beta-D-ribofuranosyl)aminobenzene 5'-phosphate synthase